MVWGGGGGDEERPTRGGRGRKFRLAMAFWEWEGFLWGRGDAGGSGDLFSRFGDWGLRGGGGYCG